jgi:hypothetical protein
MHPSSRQVHTLLVLVPVARVANFLLLIKHMLLQRQIQMLTCGKPDHLTHSDSSQRGITVTAYSLDQRQRNKNRFLKKKKKKKKKLGPRTYRLFVFLTVARKRTGLVGMG